MTRATRVALWLSIISAAHLLALFEFIPVPFLSEEHAEQILPVVSPVYLLPPTLEIHKSRLVTMVVAHLLRLICTLVTRTRTLHIPRMHRRVYGVVECEP